MKYSDYGADLYGLALVTTKKFADENPNTVRGVVKALNRGTKDSLANPEEALAILKKREPILKMDSERLRLQISNELTAPPYVMTNGLSSVTPKKLKFTIRLGCLCVWHYGEPGAGHCVHRQVLAAKGRTNPSRRKKLAWIYGSGDHAAAFLFRADRTRLAVFGGRTVLRTIRPRDLTSK